jgi:Glycosyltransferase family 87
MFLTTRRRSIALTLWIITFLTIPIWAASDHPGWDTGIYDNAIVSVQAGHDPYSDAMAIQDIFHRTLAQHTNATPPYSYVYTPLTLPLLRLIGHLPVWFACTAYWILLIAGTLSVLWITTRAQQKRDRTFIALVAPLAIFCPGLLANDTILSGNVAFILYALVILAAYVGWTRNTWRWCYLAIVIASCFKPPLLTLLAIPVFSARRQWLPAGATAALGLGIFAAQSRVMPALFLHFMRAVQLQFTYNHDFGSAPAGVFSNYLAHHGVSYTPASLVFYLLYAAAIVSVLYYLSRQYLDGALTLQQWMPVLLTGAILLNPRIMEYDAAPIAIPMALIAWRFFTRDGITIRAVLNYLGAFLTANLIACNVAGAWKPTECLLLTTVFSTGAWSLLQHNEATLPSTQTIEEVEADEELVPA